MSKLCNARTARGFCRAYAMPGRDRCRIHGGASTGPATEEGRAASQAAMQAGRARWLAERAALKEQGLLPAKPKRRRKAVDPEPDPSPMAEASDTVIEQGRAIVTAVLEETPDPAGARPWDELNNSEQLASLTRMGLGKLKEIFEAPLDLADTKRVATIKDAALSLIGQSIRVDATQLRARKTDTMAELLERLRREELAMGERDNQRLRRQASVVDVTPTDDDAT